MSYIGPERRKGDRRGARKTEMRYVVDDRRVANRRQEAHAGVIVGLSAEDMLTLAALWQAHEQARERVAA